jgi:hypothetical protein
MSRAKRVKIMMHALITWENYGKNYSDILVEKAS